MLMTTIGNDEKVGLPVESLTCSFTRVSIVGLKSLCGQLLRQLLRSQASIDRRLNRLAQAR